MPEPIAVVTGTGIICAAGRGLSRVWESVRLGQSGLGPLTLFPSARYGQHLVGQVREDVNALAGKVRGSRSDKLAWIAALEALTTANLATGLGTLRPERVGVILGCTVGGMLGSEQCLARWLREKKRRFGPLRFHECAGAAELCAQHLGARGPCLTVSTACSAGAMAIGLGAELILSGEVDLMLVGGADSLCRLTLNGFGSLLLLDPLGCRPFDAQRRGISLGEGAAMLVLESEQSAHARGATVLAQLTGWGSSCDAFHATAPHPEGRGARAAVERALRQSRCTHGDIDYVSAHGTGTLDNDAMEAKALKQVFENRLPPVASVMRFFGHTLGASGAIKAVLCVQAAQQQALPPNLGLDQADINLGFEPLREFRPARVTRILSTSFGFGGNNVALVFTATPVAPEADRPIRETSVTSNPGARAFQPAATSYSEPVAKVLELGSARSSRPPLPSQLRLAVVGVGVASPAGSTRSEVRRSFQQGITLSAFDVPDPRSPARLPVYACREFGAEEKIDVTKGRKLSRLQQMSIISARNALSPTLEAGSLRERACIVFGTGWGSLNETAVFLENMILKEERAPRPLCFTNSVHNSLASQIAIELGLAGLNSTPMQREISFEAALWQAASEIVSGNADLGLVGAADELNQYVLAAGSRWGWWAEHSPRIRPFGQKLPHPRRPLPGEGCAVFALIPTEKARAPLAVVSGIRTGRCALTGNGQLDAEDEARWIEETLTQADVSLEQVTLLLTGRNGWSPLDCAYEQVAESLSRLAGRPVHHGAYKQCCGEYPSASAFGFLTAIGLARGEIAPALCMGAAYDIIPAAGRNWIVLYTLSATGGKGMCCVCA